MAAATAIICGAGPGGLATALALRAIGIEPVVYDRQAALNDVGAGITLWPNGARALARLGVAEAVARASASADRIEIRSSRGKLLDLTPQELMRRQFGGGGLVLHRRALQTILAEALGYDQIRLGLALEDFVAAQGEVNARFADNSDRSAHLLVGADGLRSRVRTSLLGEIPLRYAGYTVWRGVAPFAAQDSVGTLSVGRGAQFGLFPLPNDHVYWFASLSGPPRSDRARHDDLINVFAGWHNPIGEVILATKPESLIATPIYVTRPIRRCVRGRVALVGDAAHPSAPALGQGAGLAIEDAVVLASCVERVASLADALCQYQRMRVRRTAAMTRQANSFGALGQWQSPLACWVRDRLIAHTPRSMHVRQLHWMFDFDSVLCEKDVTACHRAPRVTG